MAREFKPHQHRHLKGGAHYYPITDKFTCRPQITDDLLMVRLLEEFGPLINTSWNYHGVPIVRGTDEIMYTHYKELIDLPEVKIHTVIIRGE